MRLSVIVIAVFVVVFVSVPAYGATDVHGGVGGSSNQADITGRFASTQPGGVRSRAIADGRCYQAYSGFGDDQGVSYSVLPCDLVSSDVQIGPLAPPGPAQDVQVVAQNVVRNYLRSLAMPIPQPVMSAPEGITGALHSVDLQVPRSQRFATENTSFGQLRATAHGRFTVDWGDGSANSYLTSGDSWPNSEIRHTWQNSGNYDVTVTATWNLDWKLGAFSGVITGLQTTATIEDWPVIEAQAVLVE